MIEHVLVDYTIVLMLVINMVKIKKYAVFVFFTILISCQKKESVLIYDEMNNTIETINSDYSILALDIVNISDKKTENKEVSIDFKNTKKSSISLDSIFKEPSESNLKSNNYEIRVLLEKTHLKDSESKEEEKYKLMTLSSKEINKGETNFKELLK